MELALTSLGLRRWLLTLRLRVGGEAHMVLLSMSRGSHRHQQAAHQLAGVMTVVLLLRGDDTAARVVVVARQVGRGSSKSERAEMGHASDFRVHAVV